ncbi:hypothetical protein SAY87_002871 [Trapa incisa]|uniref:Protein kinase domain-containing protein n=1 Tax=Trapa incisa TaxID=236973 RepID=A0AAN7KJL6_9MYRT|nr:hypothetical protein SAY87_002871 [Trapa incisa]
MKIGMGAAPWLAFLHSSEKSVIYGDFEASNILLDQVEQVKLPLISDRYISQPCFLVSGQLIMVSSSLDLQDFNAKLSDFGLAKLGPTDGSSQVTKVMGTMVMQLPSTLQPVPGRQPEEAALNAGGALRAGKDQPDQGDPEGTEAEASAPAIKNHHRQTGGALTPLPFISKSP